MHNHILCNKNNNIIIGMVHCLPLPGTPNFGGNCLKIIQQAIDDAKTLEKSGVDAIIVENMGDVPFAATLDIPQSTALAIVANEVKNTIAIPVGVDAAFNDYKSSLSIGKMIGGSFIRIPVFVDTVLTSEGIMKPCARECMIFRQQLDAKHIKVFADIHVKHSHMLSAHITVEQSAKTAVECGADAIIITGSSVGTETPIEMIERVRQVVSIPIFAGSGVNEKNIAKQLAIANGVIIGSGFKKDGILSNRISDTLAKKVVRAGRKQERGIV